MVNFRRYLLAKRQCPPTRTFIWGRRSTSRLFPEMIILPLKYLIWTWEKRNMYMYHGMKKKENECVLSCNLFFKLPALLFPCFPVYLWFTEATTSKYHLLRTRALLLVGPQQGWSAVNILVWTSVFCIPMFYQSKFISTTVKLVV